MGVFVIQVAGGQERRSAELVRKMLGDELQDCFAPVREVKKRKSSQWEKVRELVFPGYLFLVTDDPEGAYTRLRQAPVLMRMLASAGDEFLPLSDEEIDWIRALAAPETHVVEMSEGFIEGDKVVVTSGPLRGREAQISKIDRHKRLAWLDMRMFGRNKSIKVGLEIVSKQG